MKMIALLSVVSALLLPTLATGSTPQLTASSKYDSEDIAYTPNGKVKIALREVRAELTGPYGKKVPHRILIVFDPRSGAFSWIVTMEHSATDLSVQTTLFKNDRIAFLKNSGLFVFSSSILSLYIQEPQGNASSLDEAEQIALKAVAQLNDPPGKADSTPPSHTVELRELGLDFVSKPGSTTLDQATKVIAVRWDEEKQHWIVTLQARWKVEVTMDMDYRLVSMKRVK